MVEQAADGPVPGGDAPLRAGAQRSGDKACPFTTLYWDFLLRHQTMLAGNPRMALQVKNVARLTEGQKQEVIERAAAIRRGEVGVAHASAKSTAKAPQDG